MFFEKEILFSFGVRKIYTASLEAWKMQCKLSSLSLLQLTCCACNLLCRSFTVHYFCHQHRRRHCCHFHCCHFIIILNNQVLPSWKSSSRGSIGAKIRTTEKNGLLMFNAGPGVIVSFIPFLPFKTSTLQQLQCIGCCFPSKILKWCKGEHVAQLFAAILHLTPD